MKISYREAIEAQQALNQLLVRGMPIKASLEVANLSAEIDRQVANFIKVRDGLIGSYEIKVSAGETADTVKFSAEEKGKEGFVQEFTNKINELMTTETEEINTTIQLPDNLELKPEALKPLLPFLRGSDD